MAKLSIMSLLTYILHCFWEQNASFKMHIEIDDEISSMFLEYSQKTVFQSGVSIHVVWA